jgi:hypothetical protein
LYASEIGEEHSDHFLLIVRVILGVTNLVERVLKPSLRCSSLLMLAHDGGEREILVFRLAGRRRVHDVCTATERKIHQEPVCMGALSIDIEIRRSSADMESWTSMAGRSHVLL